jgi:hypothetical protein
VLDANGEETGVWKCDLAAANVALKTLVALDVADPPPKNDPTEYEAAMERLRQRGYEPDKHRVLPNA